MSEQEHPKEFDSGPKSGNSIALGLALFGMGWMTLMGVALASNGFWIIGVPMAVIFGIWFVRTLIRRPAWRFGGNTRPRGRSRFWETR